MNNSIYPWQLEVWRQLQQLRPAMPHAILLHGPAGTGKSVFAECFAQSLLCENRRPDGHSCRQCASCGWFSQYSHMDYRRVRPEAMDRKEAEEDAGGDADEGGTESQGGRTSKEPSKEIRISQVRALTGFVNLSTHRHGLRVIVLYPAEALNAESSNALLKMLEEPPPGTVFLLVTSNPDSLLPTILSRCRKIAMPMSGREESLVWLREQGIEDADVWLAEQGGAPITALEQARAGNREEMDEFLRQLATPGADSLFRTAERLQKIPLAQLIAWLQRWLYDIFSVRFTGTIRYYPRYQKELIALAAIANVGALLQMLKSVNERNRVAAHPLTPRLLIEDMLLDYAKVVS